MSKSDFDPIPIPLDSPSKLRQLSLQQLPQAAALIRQKIVESVAGSGGHLASNLGTVELIIALHRVFDTPDEKLFFDVGHQAYAHKLLTGRWENFSSLRQVNGISGFPTPDESPYDHAVCGHAGCAISSALGFAAAAPDAPGKLIAVVGDGAAGCGVNFEALNNASSCPGSERLIVILNDNQMSISRNVGALTGYFSKILTGSFYNRFRTALKNLLRPVPRLSRFVRMVNEAVKSIVLPPGVFFETLGFRYFGPANGHDFDQLIPILTRLKNIKGPILLHVVTEKGRGCDFASSDPERYHGVGKFDADSGELPAGTPGFSNAFGEAMLKLADEYPNLTAVTAAMMAGTGLNKFAERYPERIFDVGIAEEHAVTFAAALAGGGKQPVCAMYDTFLQRALDAVYHDTVLARRPLIIVCDRAGAVEDGPTHHGIYNCGFLRALPHLTIMMPVCCAEVETALRFALELKSPVVIRYPRGGGADLAPRSFQYGKAELIRTAPPKSPLLWGCGVECKTALRVADILAEAGLPCAVADARFLKPFDRELAIRFADCRQYTIEDHAVSGGLFSALCEALADTPHAPLKGFGWPDDRTIAHGNVQQLRKQYGIDPDSIAQEILKRHRQ